MATTKIHYFPISARSEYAKIVLEYAGAPYEHVNYNFGEHKKLSQDQCPFGQLPVLQEGDFFLAQTATIVLYLAKKHGLYPADPRNAARVDELLAGIMDCHPKLAAFYLMKQGTKEEITAHLKHWLGAYDHLLKRNHDGKGFFVGDSVTAADLCLFNLLEVVHEAFPSVLKSFPLLADFHARIGALPKVAAYIKSDRHFKVTQQE